jgi:organic hydroperoxide reductase OsmC/OhrA
MKPLPHHYDVTVKATEKNAVEITSRGLTALVSAPPPEFDGPGNLWSPEMLMVAAVADCLVLTFRAVAKLSKLQWNNLVCNAQGTVDRSDGVTRFTGIHLRVDLSIPAGSDLTKAQSILEKAEKACLVGNSLKCTPTLEVNLTLEEPALAPSA